jgi:hypothetical protein
MDFLKLKQSKCCNVKLEYMGKKSGIIKAPYTYQYIHISPRHCTVATPDTGCVCVDDEFIALIPILLDLVKMLQNGHYSSPYS